jgi:hypothetical protein
MANFTLTAGADVFAPVGSVDLLTGLVANIGAADDIDLGSGAAEDVFRLTSAGLVDFRAGGNAAGIRGVERLELAAGLSTIFLSAAFVAQSFAGTAKAGQFAVLSNGGSDTVDASAVGPTGRITFIAGGGADSFIGGGGADLVRFNAADLTSADSVNGGAGTDTLRLDTGGVVAATALANVQRIEVLELAAAGNTVTITQAMAASADGGVLAIVSKGGNDRVSAVAATTQINYFAGSGAEEYRGGTGIDRVQVTPATLSAADIFVGGGGPAQDVLRITAGGAFAANALAGVSGFERIVFSAAGNTITLLDSVFAGVYATLGLVGDAGPDHVLASATTRPVWFDPAAGSDRFEGGSGNDSLVIDPAFIDATDVFQGGLGRDRITLKTAGTVAPGAGVGISGFEEVALAAGGNTLAALVNNGAYAVIGGAGSDDVTLAGTLATASLAGGDDFLRIGSGQQNVVADGGAGFDRIVAQNGIGGGTFTIGAGLTGFEAVVVDFPSDNISVLNFTGPAQGWLVEGTNGRETVNTGAGTYQLRLGGGQDSYQVNAGTFVSISDSGTGLDQLTVAASATEAIVSADLGEGGDGYSVLGGRQVIITDLGGNDVLNAANPTAGTQVLAQLGTGIDQANLAARANWYIDLGDGDDLAYLNAGVAGSASGMLVRGGAGIDTLALVGPGWGAVTLDTRSSDMLVGADGGAVQAEFESFDLSAASSAVATVGAIQSIILTPGNDDLTILTFINGSVDAGGGTDTVRFMTPRGDEILNLDAFAGFEIFVGSSGKDTFWGDVRANTIQAGGGNDVIRGYGGADILTGGDGSDFFEYLNITDGGDTITDFDVIQDSNGQDRLTFYNAGLPLAFGANGAVSIDNGPFFPAGASIVLVPGVLANAAAVDAYLATRPLAPAGGVLVGASTSAGGPVAFWYDPTALLTGGANAPVHMVTLANISAVALLIDRVDVI